MGFLALLVVFSFHASATRFWTVFMDDWHLQLNNRKIYVESSMLPDECVYDRAELTLDGTDYNNALWAYILAASKTGEKLRVVLDHDMNAEPDTVVCVLLSADTDLNNKRV